MQIMPKEYVIPKSAKYVFVADMFVGDYVGGAELTTEAILKAVPEGSSVFKLHSQSLTDTLVAANLDKTWILCNWTQAPMEGLVELVNRNCRFIVVEYDYKLCKMRSSHLHKLQTGQECNCQNERRGKFVSAFYRKAEHVFFMSEGQRQEYFKQLPVFLNHQEKMTVLSSIWEPEDLEFLTNLKPIERKNKWAVLKGGSWIKSQEATEQYCKVNGIDYELVGNLPYRDFLKKLAEYKGLVFHPAGFDTCPRMVIEAKILGLELDLNENVQHQHEEWWVSGNVLTYLKDRAFHFWKIVAGNSV
jgi:hypothetical protein